MSLSSSDTAAIEFSMPAALQPTAKRMLEQTDRMGSIQPIYPHMPAAEALVKMGLLAKYNDPETGHEYFSRPLPGKGEQ